MSDHSYGSPTRASFERGELVDLPEIPIDVRAARAWHRAMVLRGTARNDYAASLRSYVRFAVEAGNLDEARARLASLLAYADYEEPTTVPNPIPQVESDWKIVRNLADAMYTAVDNTIADLLDEGLIDVDQEDEDAMAAVADRLWDLATGKA